MGGDGEALEGEEGEEEEPEQDEEIDCAGPEEAEKEPADPRKQAALRQELKASIKTRGKAAAAKKAVAGDKSKPTPKAKGKAKAKAKATGKAKKVQAKAQAKRKAAAKPKAKAKAKATGCKASKAASNQGTAKSARVRGQRVPPKDEHGNVLELGCSNCRYAESGCSACEKPTFRGKRRSQVPAAKLEQARSSLKKYNKKPRRKQEDESQEESQDHEEE